MLYAYHLTGIDFHAFMPLLESLIDSGDLQPEDAAIAYSTEDPSAKNIYVVATLPILPETEDFQTISQEAFEELCRWIGAGTYATWGNRELFDGKPLISPAAR